MNFIWRLKEKASCLITFCLFLLEKCNLQDQWMWQVQYVRISCGCLNQLHVNATALKVPPSLVCILVQNKTNNDGQATTEGKKKMKWQNLAKKCLWYNTMQQHISPEQAEIERLGADSMVIPINRQEKWYPKRLTFFLGQSNSHPRKARESTCKLLAWSCSY